MERKPREFQTNRQSMVNILLLFFFFLTSALNIFVVNWRNRWKKFFTEVKSNKRGSSSYTCPAFPYDYFTKTLIQQNNSCVGIYLNAFLNSKSCWEGAKRSSSYLYFSYWWLTVSLQDKFMLMWGFYKIGRQSQWKCKNVWNRLWWIIEKTRPHQLSCVNRCHLFLTRIGESRRIFCLIIPVLMMAHYLRPVLGQLRQ